MDTLLSLKVFRQVVESGSFVGAADRLNLSRVMVTKHVKHAERRLGLRLLNRNTRKLSLTDAGKVYFERCKVILDDLETTELELASQTTVPRGILRITAPSGVSSDVRMAELLLAFRRRCPEVMVDISFEDRVVDLVGEGYDLAMRVAGKQPSLGPSLIARRIRPVLFGLAASRDYIKRNGIPGTPEELTRHDFVAVGDQSSLSFVGPKEPFEVPLKVVLRYRSVAGLASAIAAGVGLGSIPHGHFSDPGFKEVLVHVLSDYTLGYSPVYWHCVYAAHRYTPIKIRCFVDVWLEYQATVPQSVVSQR
jgi:DNA-binding transcriptional LysR family regulator